jgi:hypothetical protein
MEHVRLQLLETLLSEAEGTMCDALLSPDEQVIRGQLRELRRTVEKLRVRSGTALLSNQALALRTNESLDTRSNPRGLDKISQIKQRIEGCYETLSNYVRMGEELLMMPKPDRELLRLNAEIANTIKIRIAWSEQELGQLKNSV